MEVSKKSITFAAKFLSYMTCILKQDKIAKYIKNNRTKVQQIFVLCKKKKKLCAHLQEKAHDYN